MMQYSLSQAQIQGLRETNSASRSWLEKYEITRSIQTATKKKITRLFE